MYLRLFTAHREDYEARPPMGKEGLFMINPFIFPFYVFIKNSYDCLCFYICCHTSTPFLKTLTPNDLKCVFMFLHMQWAAKIMPETRPEDLTLAMV